MLRIFHNTHYDFIKHWRKAAVLTIAWIVIGLGSFAVTRGFRESIEFTGGTEMLLKFHRAPHVDDIRATLDAAGVRGAEIQSFGSDSEYTVRAQDEAHVAQQAGGAESVAKLIDSVLTKRFGPNSYSIVRTEAIGPRVGNELRRDASLAVLISFLVTLVYLAFRFEWRFGVAAVVATAHDILTTIAFLKILHFEISLTIVAAILTVIGYSLNDTIIIFDRVREDLKKQRKESLYDTLNRAVNETLPRSILTHATAAAATLALLLFAGEVIRPFAWVMLWGIVTGTFSSIYVAAPVLLWIERKWPRKEGLAAAAARRSAGTAGAPAARPATTPAAAQTAAVKRRPTAR